MSIFVFIGLYRWLGAEEERVLPTPAPRLGGGIDRVMSRRSRLTLVVLVVALGLLAAGCGSGG